MRLLVTRPEPDAARTAQALRQRGHAVLIAPLLRVETVEAELSGSYGAVLMTSANAARAVGRHARFGELSTLPVLTVGDRTADAAREQGFTNVESAEGALPDLIRLAASRFNKGGAPLLYLAGEDRAGDLAGALAVHDVAVETVVIYRAVAAARLAPDVVQALSGGQLDGVLHYSRRSATTLLTLAKQGDLLAALVNVAHFCMSDDVAAPLREAGASGIKIAHMPAEAALIGLT